ncbi:MAG: helix-turn-helix domain-containing protein [Gemmataceae bacterium]|nr:helix-turn-helix domain-containing protein [Gemmataceae bacterium]
MVRRKKGRIKHEESVQLFAERLRELRRSAGKTQRDLAREALVTETYISRLESAQAAPGIDLVVRLASALSATIADLLPTAPPSDRLEMFQAQAKRLFDTVLKSRDQSILSLLNQFLALLAESVERNR